MLHAKTNETIVRTIGHSLSAALDEHVQTADEVFFFPTAQALQRGR